MSAGWDPKPFNERNPFGKATVVGGDNISHSQRRYEAIKAVKNGTATPEQRDLVEKADEAYQMAMELREQ